ncbi:MAG: hypothetical protein J6B71_07135, partial [Clostridia bacterium]|nr:hypothetical protein [Clostridia bacterium]
PCKQNAADDHTDDDLHCGVNIAFSALFGNNGLHGGNGLLELGFDFADKVSHNFFSCVFRILSFF